MPTIHPFRPYTANASPEICAECGHFADAPHHAAASAVDWDSTAVQTIRVSRPGVRSVEQTRAAAAVRREATRRGVTVVINHTGAGGSFHVRVSQ